MCPPSRSVVPSLCTRVQANTVPDSCAPVHTSDSQFDSLPKLSSGRHRASRGAAGSRRPASWRKSGYQALRNVHDMRVCTRYAIRQTRRLRAPRTLALGRARPPLECARPLIAGRANHPIASGAAIALCPGPMGQAPSNNSCELRLLGVFVRLPTRKPGPKRMGGPCGFGPSLQRLSGLTDAVSWAEVCIRPISTQLTRARGRKVASSTPQLQAQKAP